MPADFLARASSRPRRDLPAQQVPRHQVPGHLTSVAPTAFEGEAAAHEAPIVRRWRWMLDRLAQVLSPDEISLAPTDLEAEATAPSGRRLPETPLAVIRPTTVAAVQILLKVAGASGATVVSRGAGAGAPGITRFADGTLVLSTERLNKIISIEPDDEIAVVQSGVTTVDLDAAAGAHGLTYPPHHASSETTCIGDDIAIHTGSQHTITHSGGIRESVRALTVVLPDGSLLRTGRATIHATGNDLTALFVGSQEVLGVIVEATVRLRPRPVRTRTAVASFDSLTSAADGVTAIIRSRTQPSVLDVANRGALTEIDRTRGTDLAAHGAALLVVQTAGYGADEEMDVIAAALSTTTGRVTYPGEGDAARYSWLRHHGREPAADRWTISQDVGVPRSALSSMLAAAEHLGHLHGVDVAAVAHAGDGILHLSWSVPQHPLDGNTRPPSLLAAVDEVDAATCKLGGATSNVRGTGLLTQEIDKAVTALRRDLRAVMDPHGVLGPDARVAKESQDPKVRQERDSTVRSLSPRSSLSRTGRTQTYRLGIHEFRA